MAITYLERSAGKPQGPQAEREGLNEASMECLGNEGHISVLDWTGSCKADFTSLECCIGMFSQCYSATWGIGYIEYK